LLLGGDGQQRLRRFALTDVGSYPNSLPLKSRSGSVDDFMRRLSRMFVVWGI
jgi:hypothetical protein